MGVWSTDILGNDISSDVYDNFVDYFKRFGPEVALAQAEKDLKETDEDEMVFCLSALVYAEWKCDVVEERHLQKLLSLREHDTFGSFWPNKKNKQKWVAAVDKLINDCIANIKPKRTIKQSKSDEASIATNWNQWDVYAYRFSSTQSKEIGLYGKYVVLQKIGDHLCESQKCDIIRIVNHVFDNLKDCENFDSYTLLPMVDPEVLETWVSRDLEWFRFELSYSLHYSMYLFEQNEYPSKKLTFLANSPNSFEFDRISGKIYYHGSCWKQFERHTLIPMLDEWMNKEDDLKRYFERLIS